MATTITLQVGVSPDAGYSDMYNRELFSSAANTVQGPAATEEITWYAAADQRNDVFKWGWTTAQIPSNATITAVTITLYKTGATGTNPIYVRRLLRDWVDAQVTWNSWKTSNTWSTAGCKNDLDRSSTISAQVNCVAGAGTMSFSTAQLVTDVQNFVNGTWSNYGWYFGRDGDTYGSDRVLTYATKTNATTANRPKLIVTYDVPAVAGRMVMQTN